MVLPEEAELGILHPCLMRIQPDSSRLMIKFLVYLIQDSYLVQRQLLEMSNATTIEVIYSGTMREVRIPLPPIPEQRAIAAFLDRETAKLDALADRVHAAIDRLDEYRTALIAAAVTGKIDVRDEVGRTFEVRPTKCVP
jgi:type I restriction enzyme S subunit